MSIEHTDVVDFVSIDHETGEVSLTISDHLDWDQNEGRHLVLLQSKLNAYLRFIESGEISEKFPESDGRPVVINVVGHFPLGKRANYFFEKSKEAIRSGGLKLQLTLFHSN